MSTPTPTAPIRISIKNKKLIAGWPVFRFACLPVKNGYNPILTGRRGNGLNRSTIVNIFALNKLLNHPRTFNRFSHGDEMAGSGDGHQFKIGNQASQALRRIHGKGVRVRPSNSQHRAGNLWRVCPNIEGNGFKNLGFMLRVAIKDGRFRIFFEQSACGCALTQLGAPCVAQRVWEMPRELLGKGLRLISS